jgi:muconate cycloisomerase
MGIKFRSIEIREIKIPFRFEYSHNLAARSEANTIIVAIYTDSGHIGYGEAIPRSYLTGETIETCKHDILKRWWPRVKEVEVERYADLLSIINDIWADADHTRHTASYAGIELACIDALGKAFSQPARYLVSGNDSTLKYTDFTAPLGGGNMKKLKWTAIAFRLLGFKDVKLKLGYENDEERVKLVRGIFGSGVDIRVDSNAAWSTAEAIEKAKMLKRYSISSIEQPVEADNIVGMARARREGGIEIMADESLCNVSDARELIASRACGIFNIRLAKCGGYSGALAIMEKMNSAGLCAQIGVLVGETSILTAAGQEFLCGVGPQRYHETSFPKIFLKTDIANGASGVFFRGKASEKKSRPGFGVNILMDKLDSVTLNIEKAN